MAYQFYTDDLEPIAEEVARSYKLCGGIEESEYRQALSQRNLTFEQEFNERLYWDAFYKLDKAWDYRWSFNFALEMFDLISNIAYLQIEDKSDQRLVFDIVNQSESFMAEIIRPLVSADYDKAVTEGSVAAVSRGEVFYFADLAMKPIQSFSESSTMDLPEPFYSYLRDGMVSKLTYEEACAVRIVNRNPSSGVSCENRRVYVITALREVKKLRGLFLKAFSHFSFLNDDSEKTKKILEYKEKFLQLFAYECMFSLYGF